MKNFNFSFSTPTKNKRQKEKVILTYHDPIEGKPEYYTFIDEDGREQIFNSNGYSISKASSLKTVATKSVVTKLDISFVPSKDDVEYKDGYYTYYKNGTESIFEGNVIYDSDLNSYIGIKKDFKISKNKIQLFKED